MLVNVQTFGSFLAIWYLLYFIQVRDYGLHNDDFLEVTEAPFVA